MGKTLDNNKGLDKVRVLVIDDNAYQADCIIDLLADIRVEAKAVHSGEEALKLLAQKENTDFSCILMDLNMPGMDGFETTAQIRNYGTVFMSRLPIIAMLTSTDASDAERVYSSGMNGLIYKPITPEELYATLRRVVNQTFLGQAAGKTEELMGKSAYILSDDVDSVLPLSSILKECGIDVQVFTDFEMAANMVEQEKTVDFAFIKWENQATGFSLTTKLKLFCANTFRHLVAVASDWSEIETKATELALDAYVLTPFKKLNVQNVLLKLLHEAKDDSLQEADFPDARVLIVDDNELTSAVLQNAIESFNAQADVVNDGKSALELLSASEPNKYLLVFMDIFMPGMTGFELTARLRKMRRSDIVTLPVIGMSGNSSSKLMEKAMSSGMNALLLKPVSKATLRMYMEIFQNEKLYGGIITDCMMNQINALSEQNKELTTDIYNERFSSTLLRHAVGNLSFTEFMKSVITELQNTMPDCERICISSINNNGAMTPFCRIGSNEAIPMVEKCKNCNIFTDVLSDIRATHTIKATTIKAEDRPQHTQLSIPVLIDNNLTGLIVIRFSRIIDVNEQLLSQMKILSSIVALVMEREIHDQKAITNAQETTFVLESSPFPVVIADQNGNFLRGNRGLYEVTGLSQNELQKKTQTEFLDAFRDENGVSPIEELVKGKCNSYSRIHKIKERFFQEEFNKVQTADGKLERIIGTSIDVTKLNRIYEREHLLHTLLATLIREEDLTSALKLAIEKLLNYYSAKLAFVFKNNVSIGESPIVASYQRNGENTFSRLGRKPVKFLQGLTQLYGDNSIAICHDKNMLMDNTLWGGVVQSLQIKSFYGIRLTVDEKYWGHLGLFFDKRQFSMSNEEQKALVTFGHFVEMMISRHNNNERMVMERDKALAAEKSKDLFFATVSHDIRTPLNSILGFSELLNRKACTPEEEKTYLDNIILSGNTLKELIDDVLDLSSLTQGRTQLVIEPHDFEKVCHDIIQTFSLMAKKNNLVLKANIEPMPTLEFDLQRIRQILTNYINNAIKFTPSGSITLHAMFAQNSKTQGTLTFEVIDTGIGIAPQDLPKLAQPFVQLGGLEQRQMGTGLGLTICKDLLKFMGGCQQIESAGIGHGSTFRAVLPGIKYQKKLIQQEKTEAEALPTTLSPEICNLNVLIADDVPLNLSVLKAMLKNLGIKNVFTAKDALSAFEVIQQQPIDVVLTDARMPNGGGRQLAEKIRADKKFCKTHIYVITGEVNFAKEEGVSQLFDEILFKPITIDILFRLFLRIPRPSSDASKQS